MLQIEPLNPLQRQATQQSLELRLISYGFLRERRHHETHINSVARETMRAEFETIADDRQASFAVRLVAKEMDHGFLVESCFQKCAPIAEQRLRAPDQGGAGVGQGPPAFLMDHNLAAIHAPQWRPQQAPHYFGWPEIDELHPISAAEDGVVNSLHVVLGSEGRDGLELVKHPTHNQIEAISLGETLVSQRHRNLGFNIREPLSSQAGRHVVLINALVAETSELILGGVAAGHDHAIDGVKLRVRERGQGDGAMDWHDGEGGKGMEAEE